jgi:hypothetical protein
VTQNADSGRVIGRPSLNGHSRTTTALRIPPVLYEQVKNAADERGVGVNWLIVRLIAEGMERLIPVEELRLTRPPPIGSLGK